MTSPQYLLAEIESAPDFCLIATHDKTLTAHEWARAVKKSQEYIQAHKSLNESHLLILDEQEPVRFYILLFALLLESKCVILPTKKHLSREQMLSFAPYLIQWDDKSGVRVEPNLFYRPVQCFPDNCDLVVFSSGSTGLPKGICHPFAHFLWNADGVLKHFNYPAHTSITFLKPYLLSALAHFFVHLKNRMTLCFLDFYKPQDLKDAFLRHAHVGLVGSPMQIFASLQYLSESDNPKYFFSSGDFLQSKYIQQILQKYPKSSIYKVYGLAELAGRFFINCIDRCTPTAQYDYIGQALQHHHYQVRDGELLVEAPNLFLGYLQEEQFLPTHHPHPTGDLAFIDEQNLCLQGRRSDEYKVGGNKIALKYLENQISPLFPDDVVILLAVPHAYFGHLIYFTILTKNKYKKTDIITLLRKKINNYELPHKYFYLPEILYGQTFKIDRQAMIQNIDSYEMIV